MITFLHRLMAPVMIFLLVVVGISFIFFGNWSSPGHTRGEIGMINGRKIYPDEFSAAERATEVSYLFRTGREFDRNSYGDEFLFSQTWSRLLILAEASKSNVTVTERQVIDAIKKNPIFQEKGVYSSVLFQRFMQNYLAPNGVSADRFQEIIHDELVISSLVDDIAKTAVVRPGEAEEAFKQLFGKVDAQIIQLDTAKVKSSIKPTESDIKSYYEKNLSRYASPEKRKVEYVTFFLNDKEQKLADKEKKVALDVLGKKAFAFTGKFLTIEPGATKPDFKAEAQKEGLTIQMTDLFSLDQPPALPVFKRSQVLNAVFDLNAENPVSDYQTIENGFVVIHLKEIKPSTPLSLDEARKQVAQDYIEETSRKLVVEKGNVLRKEIAGKLAAGISLDKAASELGEKIENVPAFIPVEARNIKAPGAGLVVYVAQRLKKGELSEFEQTENGGLIVYLKDRSEPDAKKRESIMPMIDRDIYQQRKQQILNEWLSSKLANAGNKTPTKLMEALKEGM